MDRWCVFDVEANGLNPDRLHCLAVNYLMKNLTCTDSYDNMRKLLSDKTLVLIGHNIYRFDIPVLEKLLGIKIECKLIDTLFLSWYLFPDRLRHGLADWGEDFGVPKPPIDDWEGLSVEEYMHRCKEDVKINTLLWELQWKRLLELYGSPEEANRLIDYLMFKADCAREQERSRWLLDRVKCEEELKKLDDEFNTLTEKVKQIMPKVPVVKKAKPPEKMYSKVTGKLTKAGEAWHEKLRKQGKQLDWPFEIEYIASYKEPNPGSVPQLKEWLFSLGWEPDVYKFERNKETNEFRQIPQINKSKLDGGGLSNSVKELYDKEPKLEYLDGYFVVRHRKGILNGFLRDVDEDGYLRARISGLTNTLRFIHSELVNLPKEDRIRGCLIAPEGYELCGSDQCALNISGALIGDN